MPAEPTADVEMLLVQQAEELLEHHDNISRVIHHLNLPHEQLHDQYTVKRENGFSFDSMLRLHLYIEVTGLTQKEAVARLRNWPYLKQRFGFDRAPTQGAISYTKRKRFSSALCDLISDVAEKIQDAAREQGIRESQLNTPDSNPDPDEIDTSTQPLHHYVDEHAPEIFSNALETVYPAFDTGRRHNTVHDDRAIWDHQLLMSLSGRAGTRSAFRTFNKFEDRALHNDTHVRAVKKLGTPSSYQYTFDDFRKGRPIPRWRKIADTITPQFHDAVSRMIDLLEPSDEFTQPVVAAIDTHRVPFTVSPYKPKDEEEPDDPRVVVDAKTGKTRVPKENYPVMVNGRKGDGWAYEYATLTIIGRNEPLIIAVEPVRHHSTFEGDSGESVPWAEIVDRLMEQATDLVDIHLVMADREFDQHGVYHVLDQYYDVDYLIPKKKDSDDLRQEVEAVKYDPTLKSRVRPATLHLRDDTPYIDVDADETVGEDNLSHEMNFLFVPAEKEDWVITEEGDISYTVFATNRENISALDAIGLTDRYSNRWDTEITYKGLAPMLPSIASKDYRMRYFTFIFSSLLYNLWRITNHELQVLAMEAYSDYRREKWDEREKPLVPIADFIASSFIIIFPSAGLDPPD